MLSRPGVRKGTLKSAKSPAGAWLLPVYAVPASEWACKHAGRYPARACGHAGLPTCQQSRRDSTGGQKCYQTPHPFSRGGPVVAHASRVHISLTPRPPPAQFAETPTSFFDEGPGPSAGLRRPPP